MGVSAATRLLQTVVQTRVDGQMGPDTVAKAKVYLPRYELVARYLELRLRWYDQLVNQNDQARHKYGRYLYGWRMRVMRLAIEAGRWMGL